MVIANQAGYSGAGAEADGPASGKELLVRDEVEIACSGEET
jgi:hypothetical protein